MLNQLNQKLPATDPCLGAAIVISKATHKIKSHFETISHIHASGHVECVVVQYNCNGVFK